MIFLFAGFETYQIVLIWIAFIILAIYLIGFFVALACLLDFRRKLKAHLKALQVLFTQKKEVLLALFKIFHDEVKDLDPDLVDQYGKIQWLDIKIEKQEDVVHFRNILTTFQNRFAFYIEGHKELENSEVETFLSLSRDLDSSYHRVSAIYNADLDGYEYWRKVVFYRPLFHLFGIRKKERLP